MEVGAMNIRQGWGGVSLHDIVEVSESIRVVETAARSVNLAALNAMLSSRRSGERSEGFRVAAGELRKVAVGLMDSMGKLTDAVSRLVNEVAEQQRLARVQGFLHRAAKAEGKAASCLDTAIAAGFAGNKMRHGNIARGWQSLSQQVIGARRQCGLGLALTRNTQIEAAYGGVHALILKQTAGGLAAAIQAISSSLEVLHGQLTGDRR